MVLKMIKEVRMVYEFETKCIDCNKNIKVYYTVADFGAAPTILHCKYCKEYYWYTFEDDAYIRPFHKQIENMKCINCEADLKNCLVPTHRLIECCGNELSLDDDFAEYKIPNESEMVPVEVYLLYSGS